MAEINNRPDLPSIFPQTDVSVEGEEHTFKVSETNFSTEAQLEYTLDKAPIAEIQSIQGVDQDGNSRTFSNGVDYELTSKTDNVQDNFTFDPEEDAYLLRYQHDTNTDVVTDENDTEYVNETDYRIIDSDEHYGDRFEWLDGGDTPENNEAFTVTYDVTFPSSVVQWQEDGENLPQANSRFYVTYRADSIISRYLDTHEGELDRVEDALQEVINNKFVESASGEALDNLGRLFGPTIGKRRGRDDPQYRIYLKSVVQSFISRGTVNGIKLAISAATDVPLEDIEIREDFENVEYEVVVTPNNPVTVQLLEEVAEIADPSGVNQLRTRFVPDPDITGISDSADFVEGLQFSETMAVDDAANITRRQFTDSIATADATVINPNKFTVSDEMSVNDANAIDPNKSTSADEAAVSDATATNDNKINSGIDEMSSSDVVDDVFEKEKNTFRWNPNDDTGSTNWNFFEWTELI